MSKAIPLLIIGAFLLLGKKGDGSTEGNGDGGGDGGGDGTDDGGGDGPWEPGGLAPGPDTDPGPGTRPGGPGGLAPGADAEPGSPYPPTTPTPTPGSSYQIASGDTLLSSTGQAYGVGSGGTQLSLSKQVNLDPINVENGTYMMPGGNEANWYPAPQGRISFNPPYQLVYFPEIDGY
jgi:hypothetical protein